MATVETISRSIGGGNIILSLNEGGVSRFMGIGNDWNTLRIGVLFSTSIRTTDITGTPRLFIGACSGTTNPLGAALTDNFVGVVSDHATWTFDDPADAFKNTGQTIGMQFDACTFVGAGLVKNATAIMQIAVSAAPTTGKAMIIAEIVKGSPNFSINTLATRFLIAANDEILRDELYGATGGATLTAFIPKNSSTNTLGTARTVAVDEDANGVLDAVNIYWDEGDPNMEIFSVCYARIA